MNCFNCNKEIYGDLWCYEGAYHLVFACGSCNFMCSENLGQIARPGVDNALEIIPMPEILEKASTKTLEQITELTNEWGYTLLDIVKSPNDFRVLLKDGNIFNIASLGRDPFVALTRTSPSN